MEFIRRNEGDRVWLIGGSIDDVDKGRLLRLKIRSQNGLAKCGIHSISTKGYIQWCVFARDVMKANASIGDSDLSLFTKPICLENKDEIYWVERWILHYACNNRCAIACLV